MQFTVTQDTYQKLRRVQDLPAMSAERIPPSLRMPNSTFVAIVRGREVVAVDDDGAKWLKVDDQIRSVLNAEWDPIGVAGAVSDEYDAYIAGILSVLESSAGRQVIADHLCIIEKDWMGLSGSSRQELLSVAETLRRLRLPDPASRTTDPDEHQ